MLAHSITCVQQEKTRATTLHEFSFWCKAVATKKHSVTGAV